MVGSGQEQEQTLDEKLNLLRNVNLFHALKEEELKVVATYSEYHRYKTDEVIFEEGSSADELFIIKDGEVLISKKSGDGKKLSIASFIAGEAFGELDLLDVTDRTASATAIKESVLLRFPAQNTQFKDILQKHPSIFARILHKLLVTIAGRIRQTNKLLSEKTPWVQDLRQQLLTDKLTGLYNRTFLEEDLAGLLTKYGEPTSIMAVKPDNFKYINDTYGHETGDKLLQLIAASILDIIRGEDVAARYRSNELAIIFPKTSKEEAGKLAATINKSLFDLDLKSLLPDDNFKITLSMGLVIYPETAKDNTELLRIVFEKLYVARDAGGNRLVCA
jgi:diguanylate cyclase (GGDEF)-like protein